MSKISIKLKAYEHKSLDTACAKIVETVKRTGSEISGPIPLPTEVEKILLENEAETAVAQDAATTEDNESSFFAGVETE